MTTPAITQLTTYISKLSSQGVSPDDIRGNLRNVGWAEDDIEQAMSLSSSKSAPFPSPENNTPNQGVGFASLKPISSSTPIAQNDITNQDYPVSIIRGFKLFIIFIGINLISIFFGYWFPDLLIVAPFVLIHDLVVRARFKYAIRQDGVYMFDGKSYETAKEKSRRFVSFADIKLVETDSDWSDKMFGIAKVVIERRIAGEEDVPKKKSRSFRLSGSSDRNNLSYYQFGTFLPAMKSNFYRIPGLKKADAEIVSGLIHDRLESAKLSNNQLP